MAKAELGEDEGRLAADIATLRWEIKNDLFQVHKKIIVQGLGEEKSPPAEDPNRWCILDTLPKVLSTMWTLCMREPHWGDLLLQFMLIKHCLIFWSCVYAQSPLRGCKFSLERSKEKLDFHFTVEALGKQGFVEIFQTKTRCEEIFLHGLISGTQDRLGKNALQND